MAASSQSAGAASSQTAGAAPRVDINAEWDSLVKSGAKLVSRMKKGPYGESKWKYEDLKKQGWKQEDSNKLPFLDGPDPRVHLAKTLKELKVSDKDKKQGGQNDYQVLRLDRDRLPKDLQDLVQGIPNHGNFENAFNPQDGVLLCHLNFRPKTSTYAGPKKGNVDIPGPELVNWSDLIFLQWEYFAKKANCNPRGLRYVFRSRISNQHTQRIIEHAVIRASINISSGPQASISSSPGIWPGLSFSTDSDEGKALLATQNGKGVALGMIDRPGIYRDRIVGSIQVFMDEPTPESRSPSRPCMLIHIVDKHAKQQTRKAPESSQQKVEATGKDPSKAGKAVQLVKGKMKEGYQESCKNQ
ncbi:MAG: hypothetical protein M1821_000945 [Bathelium mastoideum]|nr:MAG: hypothetical protein M1821_000945 [Bathelium mastoideum]